MSSGETWSLLLFSSGYTCTRTIRLPNGHNFAQSLVYMFCRKYKLCPKCDLLATWAVDCWWGPIIRPSLGSWRLEAKCMWILLSRETLRGDIMKHGVGKSMTQMKWKSAYHVVGIHLFILQSPVALPVRDWSLLKRAKAENCPADCKYFSNR